MPKRALVLSGGGSLASFQVGVIEELLFSHRLDFDAFYGVSAGALNAAILAQAPRERSSQESLRNLQQAFIALKKVWLEEITGNESVYEQLAGKPGVYLGMDSLYDPAPIRDIIWRHMIPKKVKSGRTLGIGVVRLEDGEYQTKFVDASDAERTRQLILASAMVPCYFPPVEIGGEHFVDGGVRNLSLLEQAFDAKPDEIYVVYAFPFEVPRATFKDNSIGTRIGGFEYLERAMAIMLDEIYNDDVKMARKLNDVIGSWSRLRNKLPAGDPDVERIDAVLGKKHSAALYEFRPEKRIIDNFLDFSPEGILENYEYGRTIGAVLLKLE